jgi:Ca2+-binding RTX toxin-like protein
MSHRRLPLRKVPRAPQSRHRDRHRILMHIHQWETLESRTYLAITASFAPATGILTVNGDAAANTIIVSRNAAGSILVNGGAVPISGGAPTVANTGRINVFGLGDADVITLDEANGALPASQLSGGDGNDSLTGGSGPDTLLGENGNDALAGRGGADSLSGGADNDVLTAGDGNDQAFGDAGNDRMIWNPGDDTDLNEGGDGADTVEINGGNGTEVFATTANGARVRFDRLDPAPFAIDIGTSENLVLIMNGGNDSHSATGNLAALISLTIDGGAGDDTVLGSNGADLMLGGDGNDSIDGQQGNDTAFLGAGNDTFQWDPGDGSDVIEGQADADTMVFNGSGANEIFEASANGGRLRFTRNVANIVMDTNDVETVDLQMLGGTDTLTVNDLTGTDVTRLDVDLAGMLGGTTGDAQIDNVIVNGTNGTNVINVLGTGTSYSVAGLLTFVTVTNSEGANDALAVNALGGNDAVTATTLPAGVVKLTVDGGAGNDSVLGSQAPDVLLGGDGDDFMFGDNGNDVAFMGAGVDVFQWDPGDGNDVLEGQADMDTMLFSGSNASENIDVSANGTRVRFFRDVANVTMDIDDVEKVDYRALGGADNIVVGDLSGTDLTNIGLDLRGTGGGGDGAADTITVNATQAADTFTAANAPGGVNVSGLHAQVNISFQEQANDRLTLNALGGDDVIDATSLQAGAIQLTENGGLE